MPLMYLYHPESNCFLIRDRNPMTPFSECDVLGLVTERTLEEFVDILEQNDTPEDFYDLIDDKLIEDMKLKA
jgi:hypothetical protein